MATNISRDGSGVVTFDFGVGIDPLILSDSNNIVVNSEETKDSLGNIIRQDLSFMREDPYFFYQITYSQIGTINGAPKPAIGSDTTDLLETEVFQGTASSGVTSVNGDTGAVVITAGDLGALTPTQVLPTSPLATSVAGGQVTISIGPGTNGQALVTLGGVAVWGNQTANSVGAVATTAVGQANGVASLSAGGTVPVGQLPTATTLAKGAVLQGAIQTDSTATDIAGIVADFNNLLDALRNAGLIAS